LLFFVFFYRALDDEIKCITRKIRINIAWLENAKLKKSDEKCLGTRTVYIATYAALAALCVTERSNF